MEITIDPNSEYICFDFADETDEVFDFVRDQFYDRWHTDVEPFDLDYMDDDDKKLLISSPMIDFILRLIEEKENDIKWEKRRGYR